jgi:triphosphatase
MVGTMSAPARPVVRLVPVGARAPRIDGAVTTEEALRAILVEALAQISANAPVVAEARHSEGLHQLRVGLRRLRTAAKLAGLSELDTRAKALINIIGPARDFDVFLTEMFAPAVAELGARRGFDILAARAKAAREAAWAVAIAAVSGAGFQALSDEAAAAARTLSVPTEKPIADVAPEILDRIWRRARKRGRRFAELDAPARHGLRIALKKLRYTSEFFAPLYDKKEVKRWLTPLKDLQDLLGHLNDVAQVRAIVGRSIMSQEASAAEQADLSHAAGLLTGFYQARSDNVLDETAKRWKVFRAAEPFWL